MSTTYTVYAYTNSLFPKHSASAVHKKTASAHAWTQQVSFDGQFVPQECYFNFVGPNVSFTVISVAENFLDRDDKFVFGQLSSNGHLLESTDAIEAAGWKLVEVHESRRPHSLL